MRKILFPLLIAIGAWQAMAGEIPPSRVSRHGKYVLKQLVSPGFERLPLERKLFAYHLGEALEAGRDIAWLQLSRHGLSTRRLMERLWRHTARLGSSEREALGDYYFRLMHHHGPFDRATGEKFLVQGITRGDFEALLGRLGVEATEDVLRTMFSPEFERHRDAPDDADALAGSGLDFYGPGVTSESLERSPEWRHHFLSYPVWNEREQRVEAQLHRIGGRFHDQLVRVSAAVERAKEFASAEEREILSLLQRSWKTGDPKDLLAADEAWARHSPTDIAFMLAFLETYYDPLDRRGTWEGFLMLLDSGTQGDERSARIRETVPRFESLLPVPESFKRTQFAGTRSQNAHLLRVAGGVSELFFAGINLPNDPGIRSRVGFHSFTAINKIIDYHDNGDPDWRSLVEAYYLPEYHAGLLEFGRSQPYLLLTELHEMGHASGRAADGVDAEKTLGAGFSTIEETRAELISLFHVTGVDVLLERGILPRGWDRQKAELFARTAIVQFFTAHIDGYRLLRPGQKINGAHVLARQMILNHALAEGVISFVPDAMGVPRVRLVPGLDDLRASIGRLLERVQTIKSTGDGAGATALIESLGVFTPAQQAFIAPLAAASERLARATHTVYLNPQMRLVTGPAGQTVDVVLDYADASSGGLEPLFAQEQERVRRDRQRCAHLLTVPLG